MVHLFNTSSTDTTHIIQGKKTGDTQCSKYNALNSQQRQTVNSVAEAEHSVAPGEYNRPDNEHTGGICISFKTFPDPYLVTLDQDPEPDHCKI